MENKTIIIKTYDNLIKANFYKELLENNNIQCFISDENISSLLPITASPFGGYKLNIFERDIQKAAKLIAENNE